MSETQGVVVYRRLQIEDLPSPDEVADLLMLVADGRVSEQVARRVIWPEMVRTKLEANGMRLVGKL